MKITDIQAQVKKQERFSVFVDGKYSFSISSADLLEQKVRVGEEIDQARLDKLTKMSGDSLMLESAYAKCLRRPHSEKEIRDFLRKKRAEPELIDRIIAACYDRRLLDDREFAEKWFTHRRKMRKSNRFIRGELQAKGVDSSTIEEVVSDGGEDNALRELIEKKRASYPDEKKLIAYLARQGFSYQSITDALKSDSE